MFVLLALAGLLRPEAWVLAGLYFLWMELGRDAGGNGRCLGRARRRSAGALGRDGTYSVTGEPLFCLRYTSEPAEELGRNLPLAQLPAAIPEFFAEHRRAAGPGSPAAPASRSRSWRSRRRVAAPLLR